MFNFIFQRSAMVPGVPFSHVSAALCCIVFAIRVSHAAVLQRMMFALLAALDLR
jgi:hypothetical protein